jgi:hypothetical protein
MKRKKMRERERERETRLEKVCKIGKYYRVRYCIDEKETSNCIYVRC